MMPTPIQDVVDRYIEVVDKKFIINGEWLDSVYSSYKRGYSEWDSYFTEPDFKDLEEYEKVYLAAKCHWLINNLGLLDEIPDWLSPNKYKLEKPYFPAGIKTDMFRLWTMLETPFEFKIRNIFVSENAMTRV